MTTIIVFSHLRWSFVYQRPQHLMSQLAKTFQVVVVEEPVFDASPAHVERIAQGSNLEVVVPHTPIQAAGFHDDQLSVLQPLIADYLGERGIEDYLVWFYTPMALPLMAKLVPRVVVYDCMDELAAFHDPPRQLRQRESALLKTAALVLTGGPALYRSKRSSNVNTHCLPSSVDAAHFAAGRLDPASEAAGAVERLQGHLARPRLGFYGVIDERLNVGLVEAVARARPAWQFVMVGPVAKIDPACLPRLPNIHWCGMQPYENLPYLAAGWDVCLMPFALNEATRFISPTKTLEYMACGKPVVSTRVPDVAGLYGDVVTLVDDAEGFVDACESLLAADAEERDEWQRRMAGAVRRSSWAQAGERVRELLIEALATAGAPPVTQSVARAPSWAAQPASSGAAVDIRVAAR